MDAADPSSFYRDVALVDLTALREARAELGDVFAMIINVFAEDGAASVSTIEASLSNDDIKLLTLSAHGLKGEARQFGADRLAATSAAIEQYGRAVQANAATDIDVHAHVASLRSCFDQTIEALR